MHWPLNFLMLFFQESVEILSQPAFASSRILLIQYIRIKEQIRRHCYVWHFQLYECIEKTMKGSKHTKPYARQIMVFAWHSPHILPEMWPISDFSHIVFQQSKTCGRINRVFCYFLLPDAFSSEKHAEWLRNWI